MVLLAYARVSPGEVPTAMREIIVYTRQGCHLCEDALQLLERLHGEFAFTVRAVDISADPVLEARYGDLIPVVVIDGHHYTAPQVREDDLRQALAGGLGAA
jgi:glutaredoxin